MFSTDTFTVGAWVSLADPAVAEMVAPDAEFVMLDTEHAPNSTATIANQIRAIEAADGEAVPFARALDNDTGAIKRLLDVGAQGVMVPMVESATEAREAVEAARYPPDGSRGVAGTRASAYGRDLGEYVATANDEITLIVQIETRAGLDSVDEIAAVDGVDALFVGPADLSANLGVFGRFEGDVFREAVETVLAAGDATETPVGTLATSPDGVDRYCEWGFDYLIAGTDAGHIQRGVRAMGERARENTE
ncbi:HpcH/HpaI aldolase family protein [Halosegnis longus]|uniref:Aldolase n=1 Tax=Halosegnis longus TaxID=2216012 RepID=A0AAJ4UVW6_9EURY|nr:aldolase/citrate lyase family protein [Halosegnis longus]RNJ26467.1 aldolase [Salella cibi]